MRLKDRISSIHKDNEVAKLKAELTAARTDLATAVKHLDKARAAKIKPIARTLAPKRLKGDLVRVIVSDVHGCKADPGAVAAFLADVKRLQPASIILNGDIMDCGGFLAQHHVMGYVAETLYSYEDDIAQTNHFLDRLREAAPDALIEYVEGNHENRIERWCITETLRHSRDADFLRRKLAPQFVLELQRRGIPYYRMSECYDGLTIHGTIKRGKMHYTHGSFLTSKDAARVAATKFAGNVSFGNTHRADVYIGHRPNVGVIGAWNPGCMCERQPTWNNTNPTDWTHGYAVEFVARTEAFLHVNIPIVDGTSLLVPFLSTNDHAV